MKKFFVKRVVCLFLGVENNNNFESNLLVSAFQLFLTYINVELPQVDDAYNGSKHIIRGLADSIQVTINLNLEHHISLIPLSPLRATLILCSLSD